MSTILWIVLIAIVVIALLGAFAALRRRQRSGAVMASRPANNQGGLK